MCINHYILLPSQIFFNLLEKDYNLPDFLQGDLVKNTETTDRTVTNFPILIFLYFFSIRFLAELLQTALLFKWKKNLRKSHGVSQSFTISRVLIG